MCGESMKAESKQLGISMRLISHWTPEDIAVTVRRDVALLRVLLGMNRDECFAVLNMPGAQE